MQHGSEYSALITVKSVMNIHYHAALVLSCEYGNCAFEVKWVKCRGFLVGGGAHVL